MIAKDNQDIIGDALASAKPWVDEIVVVDTGSSDQTVQIARRLGAEVKLFPWCDDFAAARNESLRHASGEWLFWMDTDDTLPEQSGRKLRKLLEQEIPEETLGFIMQVHCPRTRQTEESYPVTKPHTSGNNGDDAEPHDPGMTVVDHVKVIRNRDDLRFEGRIHEQVLPSIRRSGGKVQWSDCHVVHSGADHSPEGSRRKLERDLRILQLDRKERPQHPFVLFNLGMTLAHAGQYQEAQVALEDCLKSSTTGESHLRKAYAILVDAIEKQGRQAEALRCCWEGLGRYPNDPELAFKLGWLLMMDQHWDDAIEAFCRVLRPEDKRHFSSVDAGIKGFKTFANLATCHTELGQFYEAIGAWQECLKHYPGLVRAWENVLQLARQTSQIAVLDQIASDLSDQVEAQRFIRVCSALTASASNCFLDAMGKFESALEEAPEDVFTLNEYARFLNENERWDAMIPVLRKLCKLESKNPSPRYNLAVSLHQLNRDNEAIDELQHSLRIKPDHPPSQTLLQQLCPQEHQSELLQEAP